MWNSHPYCERIHFASPLPFLTLHQLWSNGAWKGSDVVLLLYLIKLCWIVTKQNDTVIWQPWPQRTSYHNFPNLPTPCSHKTESEFILPKCFNYYQKVIMSRFVLKLVQWEGHCYSGLHMQKKNMWWNTGRVLSFWFRRDWSRSRHSVWGPH